MAAEHPLGVGSLRHMSELIERARSWIADDPDPATRQELEEVIESGDTADLESRMNTVLEFGTAGIRGEVGAGPGRMNRAVVIRTTHGLARFLSGVEGSHGLRVVLGFDARPSSRQFAEDAAGVLGAAGISVVYFPEVTPTPLVAYATKHLRADAGVVVTASHNPPADNGYKVYGSDASQIVPPVDTSIQSEIEASPGAADVPRIADAFAGSSELIVPVPDDIVDCYWEEVAATRSRSTGSDLSIVYTPIHGVGRETLFELMNRAGHTGVEAVPEQSEPDGKFPTVDFPNPEEPGALDLALELGDRRGADLVVANDPDADRLAIVVPAQDDWRRLSGNEIGVLLGDYMLRHDPDPSTAVVASSIVSSPMLRSVAAGYGAHHESTLTGFKWIVRAGRAVAEETGGRFIFGYEEALGYSVGSTVRDKDGMSAALLFTDLVADLHDVGETVLDRLHELWRRHGLWVSGQTALVRGGQEGEKAMRSAIERLATSAPDEVGGHIVTEATDYRRNAGQRRSWLGEQALIELTLGEQGRILVRPSGTEPKLKIYVDLRREPGPDIEDTYTAMREDAEKTGDGLGEWLGI